MLSRKPPFRIAILICAAALLVPLTACGAPEPAPTTAAPPIQVEPTTAAPTAPPEVIEELATETSAPVEEPGLEPLPPDPQPVEIETADGRILEGMYYPSANNPSPIIVLMHWAGGDMGDWLEIAAWLQNRQDESAAIPGWYNASYAISPLLQDTPWLDPSWFPPMPPDISFGVLIFNYGSYGNSEAGSEPGGWLEDSVAAIRKAAQLEGADPHHIATIGASIGADGATDGCYLFNQEGLDATCMGAQSLAPGNYLSRDFTFAEAVSVLDIDGHPVWCHTAEGDTFSLDTCLSAQGDLYRTFIYPEDYHGMYLLQPGYFPIAPELGVDSMVLMQDFLEEVFFLTIN